jgi:hypothetical protein
MMLMKTLVQELAAHGEEADSDEQRLDRRHADYP